MAENARKDSHDRSAVNLTLTEATAGPNDAEEYETQFFKFTPQSFSDGCKLF